MKRMDGLVADGDGQLLPFEPSGGLPGRAAAFEACQDEVTQLDIAFQARALPLK